MRCISSLVSCLGGSRRHGRGTASPACSWRPSRCSGFCVKLDAAPFLLYLPVVILVSVASGIRAGLFATALSAVVAAGFFTGSDQGWRLSTPQVVAVSEYLIVAAVMAAICDALRKVMLDNEANLASLSHSQATLAVA